METGQVVDIVLYLATFAVIVYYLFNWVTRASQMKRDLLAKQTQLTSTSNTKSGFEDITQYERLETQDGTGDYVPLTNPLYGETTTSLNAESGKYTPQRTVPCPLDPRDENPAFASGYYNEADNDEFSQFGTDKSQFIVHRASQARPVRNLDFRYESGVYHRPWVSQGLGTDVDVRPRYDKSAPHGTSDRKWKSGPQTKAISPALLNRVTETTLKYQKTTGEILAKLITQSDDNRKLLTRALFNDQYPEDIIQQLDAKLKAGSPPLTETETRVHRTFYQLADPDSTLEDQLLGRLLTELDAKRKLLTATLNNQTLKAEVAKLEARLEGQPILNQISNIKEKYRAMVQDTRAAYGLGANVDNTRSYLDTPQDGLLGASSQAREFYPPNRNLLNLESRRRFTEMQEQDRKVLSREDYEKKYAWVDLIGKDSLPPVDDPFSPQPGISQAKAAGLRSVMDILTDYDVNNYKCQRIYQECSYRETDGFPVKPMTFQAYDHYLDSELQNRSDYVRRASEIRETLMDPDVADPDMAMDMDSVNSLAGTAARLQASAEVGDGLEMDDDLLG
jgi:hypothetical protein